MSSESLMMSFIGLAWVFLKVLGSFFMHKVSYITPLILSPSLAQLINCTSSSLRGEPHTGCVYSSPWTCVSLSAHDTERVSAGGCHSLNGKALNGAGAAAEGGAGARDSWAQCSVPAVGFQHPQSHRTAHEAGWAGGKCGLQGRTLLLLRLPTKLPESDLRSSFLTGKTDTIYHEGSSLCSYSFSFFLTHWTFPSDEILYVRLDWYGT